MVLAPVLVVAGLGAGGGTGGATARLFASKGYNIALIARGADALEKLAEEIKSTSNVKAAAFPVKGYSYEDIASAFGKIHETFPASQYAIRAALFNAGAGVWKPFLSVTPADVKLITETNIDASFAFSHHVIKAFQQNEIDETNGARGNLIFTGATASLRGNTTTSAFAAGKFALRALSQSLAKEFGPQNIHVSHAIIDGGILTPISKERRKDNPEWEKNPDVRLTPEGIAKSYWYLAEQDRSNWTWELDLRPAHEKW